MADSATVKRALSRLATGSNTDRVVIESATAGVDDLDRAATFLDGGGLSQLALAVERQRRVGETGIVAKGEHALCVFRRYRAAATFGDEFARPFRFDRTTGTGAGEDHKTALGSDTEQPDR